METNQQRSSLSVGITSFLNDQWDTTWITTGLVNELYFIEDIYSYVITGKLVFNDLIGLLDSGALVIGTEVQILYGDGPVNNSKGAASSLISFEVYKINKISPIHPNQIKDGHKVNNLELLLVDKHYQKLVNQKYSRSWSDTKVTDIIKDIVENMVGWDSQYISIMDPSNEKIDFVMSYWTPLQALNWLLQRASSNKKWGYCCYSSRDLYSDMYGGTSLTTEMKIQTLESMFQQTKLCKDPGEGVYRIRAEHLYDYNLILTYQMNGVDLFSNRQVRGGNVLGYDFARKKLLTQKYEYNDSADKFTMFGDWTLLKETDNSIIKDTESNINMVGETDEKIIDNIYYNNWIKRYSVQNTISIVVRGHESRTVGDIIELKWPAVDEEKNTYNKNLHGKYLIKSITHHFADSNRPFYKQKLGLIRNAYNYENLNESKAYQAKNTNKTSIKNKSIVK